MMVLVKSARRGIGASTSDRVAGLSIASLWSSVKLGPPDWANSLIV